MQQKKQSFCGQIPVSLCLVFLQFHAELILHHPKKKDFDSANFSNLKEDFLLRVPIFFSLNLWLFKVEVIAHLQIKLSQVLLKSHFEVHSIFFAVLLCTVTSHLPAVT